MGIEIITVKNILLVEDDPQDVELILKALGEHGLANRVAVVDDGAEALDYLYRQGKYQNRAAGNPIVILLDNKMPQLDGLEVLKAIKTDERLKTIPVVALTSSGETRDLTAFYQHGANAYVVKPVNFSEFSEAIEQLGLFWTAVNEPPPTVRGEAAGEQNGKGVRRGKEGLEKGPVAPN